MHIESGRMTFEFKGDLVDLQNYSLKHNQKTKNAL